MANSAETLRVVAVIKFDGGEALVLNRDLAFVYERDGKSFIGVDGPFYDFLYYKRSSLGIKAFGGRGLTLAMADGSEVKVKDDWWHGCRQGFFEATVAPVEYLAKYYVFRGVCAEPLGYEALRAGYTGPVYGYREYEDKLKAEKTE